MSIAKVLRRRTRESWEEVDKITQTVIETTQEVVNQAVSAIEKMQVQERQAIQNVKQRLTEAVDLTKKLVDQAN